MPNLLRLAAWAIVLAGCVHSSVQAGGGPQNVAVIANPDSPDSLAIANYYVELRGIPSTNVIYIPWRTDLQSTSAAHFRDRLLKPLLAAIEERDIAEQIDFVAFSSGFPYLIDCSRHFSGQRFPPQARPMASLTSAMFYYQDVLNARPEMFSLAPHEYFAPTVNGRTTSIAFSASQAAAASGGNKPKKHLLATALGVTGGHGNTGSEITACLRRAEAADGTSPRGTIYYMQNKDVRSRVRQAEYPAAVLELAAAGVNAIVLSGVAPPSKADVAGLTTGASHVDLKGSGSTLLAGALVDNLTSAGGQMLLRNETNPQTRISEYIRLGAAGASGTVVEPFAIAQKFPSAALHVHYARGCSLAEAYYQAVAAPFHLLIIGDPLCQPWAAAPTVRVTGLVEGATLSGSATLTPAATYSDGRKPGRFELYVDGVRTESIDPGGKFMLDSTTWADGWHELRVVAIDDSPIEIQGHWTAGVEVKNHEASLRFTQPGPVQAAASDSITVELTSSREVDAHIIHNGRRLGTIAGGSGELTFEASGLGKGRTQIYAEQVGAVRARSKPLMIEIN